MWVTGRQRLEIFQSQLVLCIWQAYQVCSLYCTTSFCHAHRLSSCLSRKCPNAQHVYKCIINRPVINQSEGKSTGVSNWTHFRRRLTDGWSADIKGGRASSGWARGRPWSFPSKETFERPLHYSGLHERLWIIISIFVSRSLANYTPSFMRRTCGKHLRWFITWAGERNTRLSS